MEYSAEEVRAVMENRTAQRDVLAHQNEQLLKLLNRSMDNAEQLRVAMVEIATILQLINAKLDTLKK